MLNAGDIRAQWTQIKAGLRDKFGPLTEEELERTQGDLTELEGLLERKTGATKDDVHRHLEEFLRPIHPVPAPHKNSTP